MEKTAIADLESHIDELYRMGENQKNNDYDGVNKKDLLLEITKLMKEIDYKYEKHQTNVLLSYDDCCM